VFLLGFSGSNRACYQDFVKTKRNVISLYQRKFWICSAWPITFSERKLLLGVWVRFQRFRASVPTDVVDTESETRKACMRSVSYQSKCTYIQVIKIELEATAGSSNVGNSILVEEIFASQYGLCFMGLVKTFPAYAKPSGSSDSRCTEPFPSSLPHNNLVLLFRKWYLSVRLIDQNFACISRLLLLCRIPCPSPASLYEWKCLIILKLLIIQFSAAFFLSLIC
jgi:hypothetical protein